jgi:hypothetical protein
LLKAYSQVSIFFSGSAPTFGRLLQDWFQHKLGILKNPNWFYSR